VEVIFLNNQFGEEAVYSNSTSISWYFTASSDNEVRRKAALLALTMTVFIMYNSILVFSGLVYSGSFFTFTRNVALILLISQGMLLYLFHRTHDLNTIGVLFAVDVDVGTLAFCFHFGAVGEYLVWLLYVLSFFRFHSSLSAFTPLLTFRLPSFTCYQNTPHTHAQIRASPVVLRPWQSGRPVWAAVHHRAVDGFLRTVGIRAPAQR
jgi:hypothetical protein